MLSPTINIDLPMRRIAHFCTTWNIVELALFGSVLRDDFRSDSDIDVMLAFGPAAVPTLLTLAKMKCGLEQVLGRPIDVLTRRGVEEMPNWVRRREILQTARTVYAA